MPDRLVRDEILDSERYLDLPTDTHRLLFLHLLLLADDLGNGEAGVGYLRRRAVPHVSPSSVPALLSCLCDADLIRVYTHEGKQFFHVPRFRQRVRFITRAHPRPPATVECPEIRSIVDRMRSVADSPQKTIPNKNNELDSEKSDSSQTLVGLESDSSRQKRREEKKRSSSTGSSIRPLSDTNPYYLSSRAETNASAAQDDPPVAVTGDEVPDPPATKRPDCPVKRIVAVYHETLPMLPEVMVITEARRKHIVARWVEQSMIHGWKTADQGVEHFREFFQFVAKSKFLTGRANASSADRPPFVASLDWLMRPANWAKTVEGNYHRSASR